MLIKPKMMRTAFSLSFKMLRKQAIVYFLKELKLREVH